jgi:NAD(P)H-flavin reductase
MREQKFEVGHYAASKWGYDQTNVTFYKVVRRNDNWVWLQEVQNAVENQGDHFLSEYVVPTDIPAKSRQYGEQGEDAKVFRRKLLPWAGDEAVSVNDYALAYPWNNQPQLQTHGH